MAKTVVCFGEALWDLLPDGPVLGGAPANLAYRIESLGNHAALITRVGRDELGEKALAGMAAAASMPAVILAPKTAPPAKVAQLMIFGARVFLVDGTYDDAFDLSLEASKAYGWYCRNTGNNPFTAEGKKTAALLPAGESC